MLKLTNSLLIGEGKNRRCYEYPTDSSKCIKVLHPQTLSKVGSREKKYYEVLRQRGISWERLARYHGAEESDQGEGLVFDLVRDYDGPISKTLDHYLKMDNERMNDDIVLQIEEMKRFFMSEAIVIMDLITQNILLQKTSADSYHLIVIDGIGNNDAIPVCNHIPLLARLKTKRVWNRKRAKWFDRYPSMRKRVVNY